MLLGEAPQEEWAGCLTRLLTQLWEGCPLGLIIFWHFLREARWEKPVTLGLNNPWSGVGLTQDLCHPVLSTILHRNRGAGQGTQRTGQTWALAQGPGDCSGHRTLGRRH